MEYAPKNLQNYLVNLEFAEFYTQMDVLMRNLQKNVKITFSCAHNTGT